MTYLLFRLQVVENSSLHVSVHFKEVLSHPYIFFFHLLVNGFSVIYEYLPLLHIILNNTLMTPNGIFVAPLRDFLKYMRCYIILEGCNETLHNGVTELHNGSSITLFGEYDS